MDSLATTAALEDLVSTYHAIAHPLNYGHAMDRIVAHQIERIAESRGTTDQQVSQLGSSVARLCEYTCPIVNPDNPELLSIFADPAHIHTGRRTVGKPAKLLPRLLPMATQKEKEAFAVWWKETIILPRDGLSVKETQDGKEIAAAYTGKQARSSDPSLSARGWKSLAASCMRYDFCDLPQHPTTVYGSGDFKLYWVENSAGDIAARVIVAIRKGRFVPGPIYTNSNIAGDLLEKHIAQEKEKPREGKSVDSDTWINCRLVRVECNGGLIAPYLDQQQDATDTGDSIRLCSCRNGDFTLDSTQGVVFPEGKYTCEDCGDRMEEDSTYHDDNGTGYCEYCYCERFATCEHCYNATSRDDMVSILDWRGRPVECACCYCANSGEIDCVEIDGDFYEIESTVSDNDGNFHVIDSGTYFESDLTGEIHSTDLLHTLPNGNSCTADEAVGTGNWVLSREKIGTTLVLLEDGTRYERDKTRVVLVLKHWLELDSSGDVINRQPELLGVGLPGVACEMGRAA